MNMCAVHNVLDRIYGRRPVVKVADLFVRIKGRKAWECDRWKIPELDSPWMMVEKKVGMVEDVWCGV